MDHHTPHHITCHTCHQVFDPADRVVSAHRTSEGVVRYVRCPAGHLVVALPGAAAATPLAACA